MAAFWLVRGGVPLTRQPVVFLGSEGEAAVVARDVDGYLRLLAAGFGPFEAMMYPRHEHDPRADIRLTQIAERWAPSARQSAAELISAAREGFPDFAATMDSLRRQVSTAGQPVVDDGGPGPPSAAAAQDPGNDQGPSSAASRRKP